MSFLLYKVDKGSHNCNDPVRRCRFSNFAVSAGVLTGKNCILGRQEVAVFPQTEKEQRRGGLRRFGVSVAAGQTVR